MINLFKIKRDKIFPYIHISKESFFAIFMISLALGVFGWFFETIVEIIANSMIADRGFLYGPFIPIYFIFSFFSLLLFDIPTVSFKNFFKFFVIFAVLVTILEFITGNLIELFTGAVLWNYDHFILSYEYISLPVSLTWGIGCSLYFMFVVPLLYKIFVTMSQVTKRFIGISFLMIFPIDMTLTILDIINNEAYLKKYTYYINDSLLKLILIDIVIYFILIIISYFLLKNKKINKTYLSILLLILYMSPFIYTIIYLKNY